tara:strand:+ start:470 stop:616 length:147 start_codon:yes stop_codon:yes gene_type:complete
MIKKPNRKTRRANRHKEILLKGVRPLLKMVKSDLSRLPNPNARKFAPA